MITKNIVWWVLGIVIAAIITAYVMQYLEEAKAKKELKKKTDALEEGVASGKFVAPSVTSKTGIIGTTSFSTTTGISGTGLSGFSMP